MSFYHFSVQFLGIFFFTNAAIAQPLRQPIQPLPLLTPMQALTQNLNRPRQCDLTTPLDPMRELAGVGHGTTVLERASTCARNMGEGALPDVVGTASIVGSVAGCVWNPIKCLSNVSDGISATVTGLAQIQNVALGSLGYVLGNALPPIICSLLGGLLSRVALTLITGGLGVAAIALLVMTYLKKIQILAKLAAFLGSLKMSPADLLKMMEKMKDGALEKLHKLVDTPEGVDRAKDILRTCAI